MKTILYLICLFVVSNVSAQSWPPSGMGGNGTQNDPWQITTINHLIQLATFVNAGNGSQTIGKYYKLMNDVDYNNTLIQSLNGWDPIGNNSVSDAIFQGNFDGNSKVVANIQCNRSPMNFIGFFGYVSNAFIHSLGIETCNIIGGTFVGGLVGQADNSIIEDCNTTGSVTGRGGSFVGGLIGFSDNSAVSNCYAICEVSGIRFIGGLIGRNNGSIKSCYADGNITAEGYGVGGFLGGNGGFLYDNYNHIINCYATGNVIGKGNIIGGFAGLNRGSINYCYATGNVTGLGYANLIGGFVGWNDTISIIQNCVAANNNVTALSGALDVNRVVGKNDGIVSNNYAFDGMNINYSGGEPGIDATWNTLTSFNFYNTSSNWYSNEWSIDNVQNSSKSWILCDDNMLPRLQWEEIDCDPILPDTCSFDAFGGNGNQGDPYQIYYPCQLADLATFVNDGNGAQTANKYYKLMNDLDLIDYSAVHGWEPIGNYSTNNSNTVFQGNFDGNSKVISNLIINRGTEYNIGLFGRTLNASIRDMGIESSKIGGGQYIGTLVGYVSGTSTFENCYAINNSTNVISYSGTTQGTGGLIGWDNGNSTYTNCYAEGTLIGTAEDVGYVYGLAGLIGWCAGVSNINNCYATATITVTSTGIGGVFGVGGLVGYSNATNIYNSYTICNISGERGIGGLVGSNNIGTISGCYTAGNLYATEYTAGGIMGRNEGSTSNCYSTVNVSGTGAQIGGLIGTNYGNISYSYATGTLFGVSYIGGLVGICAGGTLRNCVAANDSIGNSSFLPINRVVGSVQNSSVLSDNYAYDNMIVINNGVVVINPIGNNAGISTPMDTLMSFNFYNSGTNWFNNISWDIDDVQNSSVFWGICDGETLPFLQWEGFNCGKSLLLADNTEKKSLTVQNVESTFSIYPNPTAGELQVTSYELQVTGIEVFDIYGRKLSPHTSYLTPHTSIDISDFSAGIYFVRIIHKDGATVQKVVKR